MKFIMNIKFLNLVVYWIEIGLDKIINFYFFKLKKYKLKEFKFIVLLWLKKEVIYVSEKRDKIIYICIVFVFIKVLCSCSYFKFWWSLLVRLKRNKIKINISILKKDVKFW